MTGPGTGGLPLGPFATAVRPGAVDALRLLPPEHRQVLLDTYLRRRSLDAAARATGADPLVLAVRVHAGLSALATVAAAAGPPVPGAHPEVGALLLGLLDGPAARTVAEHVPACPPCSRELARLAPAAELLSTVEGYAVPLDHEGRPPRAIAPRTAPTPVTGVTRPVVSSARQPWPGPSPAHAAAGRPRRSRRREDRGEEKRRRSGARPRVLLPVAATAALLAAGGAVSADELGIAPAPQAVPRTGAGTTPQAAVRQVTATDPGTRVTARVRLTSRAEGTRVAVALTRVTGPRSCRLLAVGSDGTSEVLGTWRVPASGYGTDQGADALEMSGTTPRPGEEIARLVVQSVGPDGAATTLVTATPPP